MKKTLLAIIASYICILTARAQHTLRVTVRDATSGQAIQGATVKENQSERAALTNSEGVAELLLSGNRALLQITYLGYGRQDTTLQLPYTNTLTIGLQPMGMRLKEVVVATGYQHIPKERATGSFVQVDEELLNRIPGTDILSRLRDVVPGLIFNDVGSGSILIRGQNTIHANAEPLIVIDNYPYDGDINNINPNDVAEVTVLKDAAAASIWGARAGNGVIVITTKKGRLRQKAQVSFNANTIQGGRPDLYYIPRMSSGDYIDLERRLFAEGFYVADEQNANKPALSPVVELLRYARDNPGAAEQVNREIEALKNYDIRNDIDRYLQRNSLQQQYALNIRGGGSNQHYYFSAGYDHNRYAQAGNSYERISLNGGNTYYLWKNKLEFNHTLFYTQSENVRNNPGLQPNDFYSYARLADEYGNPLPINRYNSDLLHRAAADGLADWQYRPLQELQLADNKDRLYDLRVNAGLKYRLIPGLQAELLYQYGRSQGEGRNYRHEDSYYVRNEINRFTRVNADGSLEHPVPPGGILDRSSSLLSFHNLRGQLSFNRTIGDHGINAIAGAEMREQDRELSSQRWYGYDDRHATLVQVNYMQPYTSYINPLSINNYIVNNDRIQQLADRFLSYYANASYTYGQRYMLSLSARLDQSNLFGVRTNQKGVPLYSAGLGWEISREDFYNSNLFPYVRLRATYGYNGNIDRTLSAFTTAIYRTGNNNSTRLPFADIDNPPNPQLRWERVRISNFAVDFRSVSNRVDGSIEWYFKRGIDLIGETSFPPSSGITSFRGNTAETRGKGLDLILNTSNINGRINWKSTWIYSYATDKVTAYHLPANASHLLSGALSPQVGKPLYALYSYQWGGLDPQTGDPMGYLDAVLSKDYVAIRSAATADNIIYHGSRRPVHFGSLRNTITYRNFELSAMISYRLGYYFRMQSISYGNDYGLGRHGDYALRWQQPGDELYTRVPSLPPAANTARDEFYLRSAVLTEKGDHIRLQDVRLSYRLKKRPGLNLPFAAAQFYVLGNNLGILWKETKQDIDPGSLLEKPITTIAAGLKLDF